MSIKNSTKIILLDIASKDNVREFYEHLGLGYLACVLRQHGWNVKIMSCIIENRSLKNTIKQILNDDPNLLGISVKSIHAKRLKYIVKNLRKHGYPGHITIGGHFATFHHQEILRDLPMIDSVIRGEGEYTILELAEKLMEKDFQDIPGLTFREGNRIIKNQPRKPIVNLDQLPFPARDLTEMVLKKSKVTSLSASRGCYANCSFCSIANFYKQSSGKKWRCRSPENIVDEIELLADRYNTRYFKFIDDQLFLSIKKGKEFIKFLKKELSRRNLNIHFSMNCRANLIDFELFSMLKNIGLEKVFIGIESAHQRGLDTFNKDTTTLINNNALKVLDSLNIDYDVGFILIDPYTTYQELHQNLSFLSQLKQRFKNRKCMLSVTTSLEIYGGTPIYKKLLSENRLFGDYMKGFTYRIEDAYVRIFKFIMENIIAKQLLPIYNKLKFVF